MRGDLAEVTVAESGHFGHAEACGDGDDGSVGRAERELAVLDNDLGRAAVVGRGK